MNHDRGHLIDGLCACDCPECVSPWRRMDFGGARRSCVCPDCAGGDCPNWRLDLEMHARVCNGLAEGPGLWTL